MYVLAVVGNVFLIFMIVTERSLHEPMCIFLSMLASTDVPDVLLSMATAPKMLAILWFQSMDISFGCCMSQMFFLHFIFVAESAILLAMAFDRYVANCHPLRYTTNLTLSVTRKMGLAAVVRCFIIRLPFVFLVYLLRYCGRNIIPHSYCEHMGIARLACDNIRGNIIYGLTVALLSTGLDVVFIIMPYSMILCTVFLMPSWAARLKALNTCASHICVNLIFYAPAFFSFFTHRFGQKTIPHYVHILVTNLYVVVPPMLTPIIYGVKTKQIQDRAIWLFSCISTCC
ncbi:LOW QUALITY PROTEIN: olfactory receptor 52Z1-like [Ailuropoda melanoleuca]|uniref:LOW QUALITY PROTEIN: olfactory receptor 52Z1-like n=1 Tax=Ailuropoda melanoleuca TaxID=9646 RepID=UPI0014941C1D|nr:LOW QUALITY PROTEIN: olfactory receptor 52Z1-like [Ailuropoda melanoleuca]XP_034521503.1 LOW QUALITY PROTEIN: olfactory receptor 52Z1-like [Ailuropoda melanoleuca]